MPMETYRGYRIEKTKNGYRITLDNGSGKHTHIHSKNFCKKLIDYVVDEKIPRRVSNYVLVSLTRLSTNQSYIKKVNEFLKSRNSKTKQKYYNPSIKKKV